jgi:hypothetical protein
MRDKVAGVATAFEKAGVAHFGYLTEHGDSEIRVRGSAIDWALKMLPLHAVSVFWRTETGKLQNDKLFVIQARNPEELMHKYGVKSYFSIHPGKLGVFLGGSRHASSASELTDKFLADQSVRIWDESGMPVRSSARECISAMIENVPLFVPMSEIAKEVSMKQYLRRGIPIASAGELNYDIELYVAIDIKALEELRTILRSINPQITLRRCGDEIAGAGGEEAAEWWLG